MMVQYQCMINGTYVIMHVIVYVLMFIVCIKTSRTSQYAFLSLQQSNICKLSENVTKITIKLDKFLRPSRSMTI